MLHSLTASIHLFNHTHVQTQPSENALISPQTLGFLVCAYPLQVFI